MNRRAIVLLSVVVALSMTFVYLTFFSAPPPKSLTVRPATKARQQAPVKEPMAAAAPQKEASGQTTKEQEGLQGVIAETMKRTYTYTAYKKRDPFVALIIPQVAKEKEREESVKRKGTTPLEIYDPSQFKLIAVLWDSNGFYAVITLPDGKSYTLREGVRLGQYGGEVYKITKDSIIIRETMRDKKGTPHTKDTTLRLHMEEAG
ncbi:MAG: pilus assembly protein PilP [Dissulfurispiraceae bacterium]